MTLQRYQCYHVKEWSFVLFSSMINKWLVSHPLLLSVHLGGKKDRNLPFSRCRLMLGLTTILAMEAASTIRDTALDVKSRHVKEDFLCVPHCSPKSSLLLAFLSFCSAFPYHYYYYYYLHVRIKSIQTTHNWAGMCMCHVAHRCTPEPLL